MLPRAKSWDEIAAEFRWPRPTTYNIAVEVCERRAAASPDAPAIVDARDEGRIEVWSYRRLSLAVHRLSNVLAATGIGRGDRVAILLPQSPDTVIAHLAVYALAAVALPLAEVFGVEALDHRLGDAGVRAVITHHAGAAKIAALADRLPSLETIWCVDGPGAHGEDLAAATARASDAFTPVTTGPDDPALMIYTSGTTGLPKGALHGHRVLLGHLPGVQLAHEFLPAPGDLMWTPADWAWAGGLLNALLPALAFGVPVVAGRGGRFDPDRAVRSIIDLGVRNVFLPPTALKMMRSGTPAARKGLSLRSVASAGEALGRETWEWGRSALGVAINEWYGQTECNLVLGSAAGLGVSRAGAIGRPVPGHRVALLGPDGAPVRPGEVGQIAVARPDPVMFLGYWNQPAATAAKFRGDWLMTGDQGIADDDGYVTFVGRDDDLITSSGYRIGPAEIEDCLIGHPAVGFAAVVGKPDRLRTEIVKAYVKLRDGVEASPALAEAIRAHVRERLSAHEYPREIAFVDEIPMTTTGKVIRRFFREDARAEAGSDGPLGARSDRVEPT
ncbi:AMP-dependent synthetase [Siculibacillus lacustris]|uniref:AMP-dependent synthetase n=1 Tax=Siculibacillus lacustris TaxID=1549641 RepID=A0A4Q9VN88_9HYPH|nr:AMP-binding protein [Siculibacillus lacustris]TBW36249.1 AMP-dependent synthetase [Siculibacillus lacustris]